MSSLQINSEIVPAQIRAIGCAWSFQRKSWGFIGGGVSRTRRLPVWARVAVIVSMLLALQAAPAYSVEWEGALTRPQSEYLQELLARAHAEKLWQRRVWQLLLHYRVNAIGSGSTSEADDPGFFMATDGRSNPSSELAATLAAFFSGKKLGPRKMTPQCVFPARYHWLNSVLRFDASRLPEQDCVQYKEWRHSVHANSVSLIFSSYFINNPASMFGHTLLLFHEQGDADSSILLGQAVNYAAGVPPDANGFAYIFNGIFGGYQGRFSMMPYYLKVREYNDLESRDMWEYRLNLSPGQIETMLRHAWELGGTYFDYYYFDENCSYHLLSLLEMADPRLHLTDEYGLWTIPIDTVKQIARIPNLVAEIVYRPSLGSQIQTSLSAMSDVERDWVYRLSSESKLIGDPEFRTMAQARSAQVMDTAILFHRYKLADRPAGEEQRKANLRALLLARAKMPQKRSIVEPPLPVRRPESGHDSSRFDIALGEAHNGKPSGGGDGAGDAVPFVEFTIQSAFHNLMSADAGYAPNSHINLLHGRARYDSKSEQLRLERLALVDIISLFPLTRLIRQPSWKIGTGWQRVRGTACGDCIPFFLNPGIGAAFDLNLRLNEVVFAMLEGRYENNGQFESGFRAGLGVFAGILFDAMDAWRVGLLGSQIDYTLGHRGVVTKFELRQRVTLSRNIELNMDLTAVENYREGKIGIGVYF